MADTPQQSQSTYGGGKPPSAQVVVKPRVSGQFPWDVQQQDQLQPQNPKVKNKGPQVSISSSRPSRGHSATPSRDTGGGGGGSSNALTPGDSVFSEENALLEELDEVLSSTTGSKSSKSTADSRLTDNASTDRGDTIILESFEPNDQQVDRGDFHYSKEVAEERVSSTPVCPLHGILDEEEEEDSIKELGKELQNRDKMWNQRNNQEFDTNEGEKKEEDSRAPRYGGRQFTNYEEMLDNLDAEDPYSKEPPPSNKKPPSNKSKTYTKPTKKPPKTPQTRSNKPINNAKTEGNDDGKNQKQGPIKRKNNNDKKSEKLNGIKTGYDNPAYADTERKRRNSTDSNRTYVLGTDSSRTALIDDSEWQRHADTPVKKTSDDKKNGRRSSAVGVTMEQAFELGSCVLLNPYVSTHGTAHSGRDFIKEHITHRLCSQYIPTGDGNDVCGCGMKKNGHDHVAMENRPRKNEKWSVKDHTRKTEADTYGTIGFQGFGHEISHWAPYIRVNESMRHRNLNDLWVLLSEVWKMPPPKMIVSVTGGAKRFFMKNRIRNSFQRGLINVATSSGAWIVTGGTGTGVMQFVGEAVRDYQLAAGSNRQPVVALGVTCWGTLDNKEALISKDKNGLFPAMYHMDNLTYAKRTAPLDPNHTHFILVDDGTTSKFGREISFRANVERFISNTGLKAMKRPTFGQDSSSKVTHIPVVLLVLEGGINTLKTTLETLKENTPIVVIQGSGRAADIIALGYKETKNDANLDMDLQRDRAFEMFDWSRTKPEDRDAEIEKCVSFLSEILSPKYRNLVTVFHIDDVDSSKEIDEAILQALLKAEGSKMESQLSLAIAWNRCDIARQQIFDFGSGTKAKISRAHMEGSMLTALLQNSSDFVQLFLDNGFDLTAFLTKRTLRSLYDEVLSGHGGDMASGLLCSLLQQSMSSNLLTAFSNYGRHEQWRPNHENMLRIVGRVINSLLGEFSENIYRSADNIIVPSGDDKGSKANLITAEGGEVVRETASETQALMQRRMHRSNTGTAERDLFLWAVLLHRQELAQVFWKAGKDHIGGALVASSLLKSLGDYASDEEEIDLANELYQAAISWEETAVGVLNECYIRDKEMAHSLLVREIDTWAGSTLMVIADSAEQMDFMGHSSCQTKLNRIWKGKMALYTSMWKIIISMVIPLWLFTIRFYSTEFAPRFRPKEQNESSPVKKFSLGPLNKIGQSVDGEGGSYQTSKYKSRISRMTSGSGEAMTMSSSCAKVIGSIYYYHTAPVTKFCFHLVSYLIFLGLFSYVVLIDLYPISSGRGPSYIEYIIWGWAGTLFIEELRQIATRSPRKILRKLSGYFDSVWNQYDLLMNVVFITTIILRHLLSGDNFVWARMFYATTLVMYYLRVMQFFYVEKNIGPKVIMIRRMLTDLSFFMAIMLTVIVAYGIAVQSLRYPNSEPKWSLLKDILYKPYWNIYGELFLEDFEGDVDGCSSDRNVWSNSTLNVARCPQVSWLSTVFFAIYMILTNILLLNLLIAMFSYTFERVQENSEKVWRFYRYSLVFEYYDKPTLAPPLIIFSHMWRVLKFLLVKCGCPLTYETDFRKKMGVQSGLTFTAFERAGMENYLLRQNKSRGEHIDAKVHSTSERIEKVIEDLEQIKEQVTSPHATKELESTIAVLSSRSPDKTGSLNFRGAEMRIIQDKVEKLEGNMKDQGKMLEKMMGFLEDIHKEKGAVQQLSVRGRHEKDDERDGKSATMDEHVSQLQGQLNDHSSVMEKLVSMIEEIAPPGASARSRKDARDGTVTPSQVKPQAPSTPRGEGSEGSMLSYRRPTLPRDPTIEIEDIYPGGGSSN